ncbi:hypothetical protein [Dickeya lacustris]|uniref:Uncharacterized protein n=1 Tax=Dickeya lacustris TaxID=2259638 RepID=A0ABY8G3Q8_9GAMM|nr:hypothetical protein [Dickeya lacustris]WFN54596.1 hypothetical protein O1Q98_13075 [Dickeya lacustris]
MNSIPTLGSLSMAVSDLKLNANVSAQQQATDGSTTTSEVKTERQIVEISAEAFKKYNSERKTGDLISKPVTITQEQLHNDFMEILTAKWKRIDEASKIEQAISTQIFQTYLSFIDKFVKNNPDLKDTSFGFSVSQYGRLVVTQQEGLTEEQITRIDRALNSSKELVEQADKLADAQIALFEAEDLDFGITFNRSNYARTIDIGADITTNHLANITPRDHPLAMKIYGQAFKSYWHEQLYDKGERKNS